MDELVVLFVVLNAVLVLEEESVLCFDVAAVWSESAVDSVFSLM